MSEPTYEELVARVAELEAAQQEADRRLRRLASIDNPRDKLLMGLLEQMRDSVACDLFSVVLADGRSLVRRDLSVGQQQSDPAANAWMLAHPSPPIDLNELSDIQRAFQSGQVLAVDDTSTAKGFFPRAYEVWREGLIAVGGMEHGSLVLVPLVHGVTNFGFVTLTRRKVRPFKEEDIEAIMPFADQMAVVLGNARLAEELEKRNAELAASVEREAALARISQRINEHPLDVDGTLLAIAEAARSLTDSDASRVLLIAGEELVGGPGAEVTGPRGLNLGPARRIPLSSPSVPRAIRDKCTVAFSDILESVPEGPTRDYLVSSGQRSIMQTPLCRENDVLGTLNVMRSDVRPYVASEVATLEAFAAQAATAIETARAQQALAERNAELAAAVQREAALASISQRINEHPLDLDGTLDLIADLAGRSCKAPGTRLFLRDGDAVVHAGFSPGAEGGTPRGFRHSLREETFWPAVRAVAEARAVTMDDMATNSSLPGSVRRGIAAIDTVAFHSVVAVPILLKGLAEGSIMAVRDEIRPFSTAEVAVFEAFAAQAATAIETARAQRALAERNAELATALEQQSVVAEVLQVISAAPTDAQRVFDTIVSAAVQLTGVESATLWRLDGDMLEGLAQFPPNTAVPRTQVTIQSEGTRHEQIRTVVETHSTLTFSFTVEELEQQGNPSGGFARERGWKGVSNVLVPLLREGRMVGIFIARREGPAPYTGEEVRLIETFADQAVIAMENARLFNELQERNRELADSLARQEAIGRVMETIARSQGEDVPVFQEIARQAGQLVDAVDTELYFRKGSRLELKYSNVPPERQMPMIPIAEFNPPGRAILDGVVQHSYGGPEGIREQWPGVGDVGLREAEFAQSCLYAPLKRGVEVTGLLVTARRTPDPFSTAEIALLEAFADQAVIAIENARLFNELQERNREVTEALDQQTAIGGVLEAISRSTSNLQSVVDLITVEAARLVDSDNCAMMWLTEGRMLEISRSDYGKNDPNVRVESSIDRTEVSPAALTLGRPIHQFGGPDAIEAEYPADAELWRQYGVGSVVHLPLKSRDSVIGQMTVARRSTQPYTLQQVALLETFADQAVIAIENARLFNELQERNREVTEALDQQTAVAGVLQTISRSAFDLDAVLQTLVEHAIGLLHASFGEVSLRDGEEVVVRAQLGSQRTEEELQFSIGTRYSIDAPVTRSQVIREGRRTAMTMHPGDPRFRSAPDHVREWASRFLEQPLSLIGVPLQTDAQTVGAMMIGVDGEHRFTEREVSLLQTFADQAVIAIENARLFNELQEKTQELEHLNVELETASQHKSDFLANMSHELRTPLNAIIGYSELLEEECTDLGDEGYLPDLAKIQVAAKHLLALINDILDLSKIEAGRMTVYLEEFDLPKLVSDVQSMVSPLIEKNGNVLVVDCSPDAGVMYADQTKVRQSLFNLLSNAAKFTEHGTITLGVRTHLKTCTLTVTDTGIGMTDEQLGRLFEAFSQAEASTSRTYGGTGLGLSISREFCRIMGGDITAASISGQGSTFTITLPLRVVEPAARDIGLS